MIARQPFLPQFTGKDDHNIGPSALLSRNDIAAQIGTCVGIWTFVETEMAMLFSVLLGTETDAALQVFLSLRRSSNQRQALQIAADNALSGDMHDIFTAIMSVAKTLEEHRNDLAHGCLGYFEDKLAWVDTRHYVHWRAEALLDDLLDRNRDGRMARLRGNLFVYKMDDLEEIARQMDQFYYVVSFFHAMIRRPDAPNVVGERGLYAHVVTSPLIARELSVIRATRNRPPIPT